MAKAKRTRIRGRLSLILLFLTACFIALCARVFYLKVVHGADYESSAITQQVSSYDIIVSPNRGMITDRNGQALAVSTTVYNIVLDVRVLVQKDAEVQELTIRALSELLEDVDYSTLKDYITINPATGKPNLDTSWKVLAKLQSRELKEELEAMGVAGVVFEKDTKRKYTADTLASQVIGFIRDGMWGLEKQYNEYMSGVPGRSFITYDGVNGAVAQEVAAQDGNTIVTTLDYTIQTFAEETARNLMTEYNPENTSVVVMDPNTGEVLAMTSAPTFNLNEPVSPLEMEEEAFAAMWDTLETEEKFEYLDSVWKNFAISSTYEPGSIFKPILVSAALEEGVITNSDTFYCPGYLEVGDRTIRCHLRSGHGTLDVEGVIAQSCNVGMMHIGAKMGANTFYKYLRDFGFGSLTGIDLPNETSAGSSALMYTPDRMGPVEIATMSFGQSFNATTIQCINAMSSLVNGGNLMKPYIVSQVVDKDGNIVKENKPTVIRKTVSTEIADIVKYDMVATVEVGTGKKAKIPGYTFGGKTGTAEQGNRLKNEHTVSFIAFFPVENPQYIAMVLMHKPENYADGVTTVAPATKDLLEKIIRYKGLEPSYELESGTQSKDTNVIVSDYTQSSLFEVLTELEYLGLKYEIVGKGNTVVNQVPHGGAEVLEGTRVTLYVEKGEDETGTVIIPNVVAMNYDEAVTQLLDSGLEVIIDGDDLGKVVKMSPKAGLTVEEHTEVTITLQSEE